MATAVHPSMHEAGFGFHRRAAVLGALGVVFGDIGTSPLYALKEAAAAAAGHGEVSSAVVLGLLHLTEVRGVEHLLEADDLRALPGGLARVFLVLGDHGLGVAGPGRLDECGAYDVGHELLLRRGVREPLRSLRP